MIIEQKLSDQQTGCSHNIFIKKNEIVKKKKRDKI